MQKRTRTPTTADAIYFAFVSPNEYDSNWEVANVVDGLFFIGRAIHRLAEAYERAHPSIPEAGS